MIKFLAKHSCILLICLLSILLSSYSFIKPHLSWDQIFYTATAMKLEKEGFKGYNLQHIQLVKDENECFLRIQPDESKTIIASQKKSGFYFYDEPFFYSPPLLPYLIQLSHQLLTDDDNYNLLKAAYASIIPLFFNILTIILVYSIALTHFNKSVAIMSAFLFCISPVSVLSASRFWSDSALTFFMISSLYAYMTGFLKKNYVYTVLAGICAGLGILTKVSGLFILVILAVYVIYTYIIQIREKRRILLTDECSHLFVLGFIALIISLPWFVKVFNIYGDPLHFPYQENVESINPWFKFVRHRPWYMYPLNIVAQNPLLLFSLFGSFVLFNKKFKTLILIWIGVLWFYLTFIIWGKENRYMLPAYPLLSILAAAGIFRFIDNFRKDNVPPLVHLLFYLILISCSMWSMWFAFEQVGIHNIDEFVFPV